MPLPSNFTHLTELKTEWQTLISKMPPFLQSSLSTVNPKLISLISKGFSPPILALPHENYSVLNSDILTVKTICNMLNNRMVNKYGGVQFIKPPNQKITQLLTDFVDKLDAEIIDVSKE